MAQCAAAELEVLRLKFKSLNDIQQHLLSVARLDGWPILNAGIASFLNDDIKTARDMFRRIELWETDGYSWQSELKLTAQRLVSVLDHSDKFRNMIIATIQEKRKMVKLAADPNCLDGIKTSKAR